MIGTVGYTRSALCAPGYTLSDSQIVDPSYHKATLIIATGDQYCLNLRRIYRTVPSLGTGPSVEELGSPD